MPSPPVVVSAIIAFLNGERFLAEAIESVLAQRYQPWELLLVDDGSTGPASAIAQGYAARSPERIRYLEHDGHRNRGVSASRNAGIAAARGDHLAFLDADDVWMPDKLADQVALLDERPGVGAMYGNTLYWRSWTGSPEDADGDRYPSLGVTEPTVFEPPELLARMLGGRVAVPCVNSLLVRTEVARGLGGFEERFTGMFEDQAFYAKLLLATPVLVVPRSWDRYRQHADSMCALARRDGRTSDARLRYLEWLERHLEAAAGEDRALRAALRRALRPYRHPRLHGLAHLGAGLAARLRRGVGRRIGRWLGR